MNRCRRRAVLATLLGLILGGGPPAARAETVRSRVDTAAGPLAIVQLDDGKLGRRFKVTLGGRTIVETGDGSDTEDFPFPRIVGRFTAQAKPHDDLFLFQQFDWGNACNGGPLWFLAIDRDGSFTRFDSIDFCGGKAPEVRVAGRTVELRLRQGHGRETWILANGALGKRR